jgi:hypothetical protein
MIKRLGGRSGRNATTSGVPGDVTRNPWVTPRHLSDLARFRWGGRPRHFPERSPACAPKPLPTCLYPPLSETSRSSIPSRIIGNQIAALAACIAYALMERIEDGAVSPATKRRAGELAASLFKFKMVLPEFDALAREHGAQVMREYVAAPPRLRVPDEAQIADWIEQALVMLTMVAKRACN